MPQIILHIKGMHCASCVQTLEKSLRQVHWVNDASVNLVTGQATITHDSSGVDAKALIDTVRRTGYDAVLADKRNPTRRSRAHPNDDVQSTPRRQLAILMIAAVLSAFIVLLAMIWHTPKSAQLQFILATPIQLMLGHTFYRGAWRAIKRLRTDMDTLVALGTSVAYGYSAVAAWKGQSLVYFDTAAVILVLVGLGRLLEDRTKHTAAAAIRSLVNLQPPEAIILRTGREMTVAADQIAPGDVVLVKPGQRLPADGVVTDGRSAVDQSTFTGESVPIDVVAGSTVIGGTINQTGAFRFRATKTGGHTLLSQVIEMVEHAARSKAHIQRFADTVAALFVPMVLVVALLTLVLWGLGGAWIFGMNAMVAVLIVACPCALGLATPTAILVGAGLGARCGILIKNAAALERAGKLSHIILDKTGTLTVGRLAVKDVIPIDQTCDKTHLLRVAASLERFSEHPLARAIVEHAQQHRLQLAPVTDFQSHTAAGVRGCVEGQMVVVGRIAALREQAVTGLDQMLEMRDQLLNLNRTAVAVAIDGRAKGWIALADKLKPNAPLVVTRLRRLGLKVMLMTGDHPSTANAIAQELGIEAQHVMARVMPQDKQAKVAELQNMGHIVAMVGDGVNDAPALASADIGIAIGSGTDIAIDAGHMVLLTDDLNALPRAVRLSRAIMRRIYGGLFWAFAYNLLLIPIAATGQLHPMLAAGAMSFSSLSVVLNALWLKHRWKP